MNQSKTYRPTKWTKDKLRKLGEELCAFVSEEGVWHISKFEEAKKLYPKCLYNLARDHRKEIEHYLIRAKRIIGNKMLERAMERGCDRWVIKTFLPRMLDVKDWVKEDLMDEAMAKVEAINAAKYQAPTHPFIDKFLQYMEVESSRQNITKN